MNKFYSGLWGRTSSGTASGISPDLHQYEKGMFAGCAISVILFLAAFNVILEYVSQAGLPEYTLSVLDAFMDDVSLMTTSTSASKITLQRTFVALKWAMMKLKPQESRGLVIKEAKYIDGQPFEVAGDTIPSIHKEPLTAMGRVYNSSVTDRLARDDLKNKILELFKTLTWSNGLVVKALDSQSRGLMFKTTGWLLSSF